MKSKLAHSLSFISQKTSFAIPIGSNWAFVKIGSFRFYGRLGYVLRRLADLRFFFGILPLKKHSNSSQKVKVNELKMMFNRKLKTGMRKSVS